MIDYTLFEARPGVSEALLPDPPKFTVVAVSNDFVRTWGMSRADVIGKGHFEIFPESPLDANFTGETNLSASFEHVIHYNEPHALPPQRYNIPNGDGTFTEKYWRAYNVPVLDAQGKLIYIIHTAEDVTTLIKADQCQEKIKGIEQAYNLFLQTPAVIGVARGPEHVMELANACAYKLWGRGPEILGKPLLEGIPELKGQGVVELFDHVYNTGETYYGKAVPVTSYPNGKEEKHYFDMVYQPYYDEGSNKPAGVFTISHDVTQMVEAQQKVEESEVRFRTMANSIPQLAWMTDPSGLIYWYNDRWYDYTGTTPEEMRGWGWRKVHHPDMVEGVVHRLKKAFESGSSWEDTFLIRSKEGEYRWFLSRAVPVRKGDGTIIGWFGTNTDITEQRKIEDALKRSEEQLLLAMEGGELGYFDYDVQTDTLIWSSRTKELFGLPPDATVDYSYYLSALYPEDRERTDAAVQKALRGEVGGYENEYRVVSPADGRLRWVRAKAKAFIDESGKTYRLAGVTVDITKQKEVEEALQQSESNLRNLVLHAPVAMCIGSVPSFIVEVANDRMLELWGKRFEEIVGRPVFEVLPIAGEQELAHVIQHVYTTGEPFTAHEMPVSLHRDHMQETAYLNFVYQPIKNSDGVVTKIIAVAIDVTDQVVARKEIEESHKEFQFAMNFLPQIFWLARPDGYHYYYNKQFYDYTGLNYNETKGERWNELFHPDDQEPAWETWRHSLETGEPYEFEYRLRRHDGQYRWFLGRALPLRDETGAITKWFGTGTEIHDQKTFTEQLENMVADRTKELKQSNEDLQQFVHVASHDLKEPVRKMNFFLSRVKATLNGNRDEKTGFYLDRVQAASNRMLSMINGVLAYSTISAVEELYESVDLNLLIKNVAIDLELVMQQNDATIRFSNLLTLYGSPVMLHQLFYNLISNSLKFARVGVPPVINITTEEMELNGKAVTRIRLQDNGIGFEQEYAEKIFGAFARLHSKDKYEGAGLGLSLCKKIVERHGGTITARGKENEGTVFEILLPLNG
ncbi:PAS domain S-box protein [Flavisolibacter tropicus]|uniref:PAS domain S-box protein n=1 Tax=Flavisolibacter tropicus TaxID=1492898 RepID=UPI000835AC4A|nr:PAS domain S-box protein [Flavisolibacter tropicus]